MAESNRFPAAPVSPDPANQESSESGALIVRAVRHEVGDFLQLVYSTLALLDRPACDAELQRTLIGNLRSRAAACRTMLDTATDLACPIALDRHPLNLVALTTPLVQAAGERFRELRVQFETTAPTHRCWADRERLARVLQLLLFSACEAARREVSVRIESEPSAGEVQWTVTDDSPGLSAEQLKGLFQPGSRSSRSALGLAPVQKIVLLHGGRVAAANLPDGGFQVSVILPVGPANGNGNGNGNGSEKRSDERGT